jgi:uncharacterized protein YkwD
MKTLTTLLLAVAIAVATLAGPPTAHAAPAPDASHVRTHATPRAAGFAAKVIALVNKRRADHGCNPLRANKAITRAARKHTRKMANANSLSHQLPGEPSLGQRLTNAGYKHWRLVGENIAYGYPTPKSVVRGWMNSPDHRQNILKCRFRDTGVGYATTAAGVAFWTQDFGKN